MKKSILILAMVLIAAVGFGQTKYELNYDSVGIGKPNTTQGVKLNGKVWMKNLTNGTSLDSQLVIRNGRVFKVLAIDASNLVTKTGAPRQTISRETEIQGPNFYITNTPETLVPSDNFFVMQEGSAGQVRRMPTYLIAKTSDLDKKQQNLKIVNVEDFGAVGDNVTDNTIAFKNAILSIPNGGTIWVPIGQYKISDSLVIPSYVHFKGEDRNTAQIIQTSATKCIFKINKNKEFVYIHDLFLDNSSGSSTTAAIDLSGKNHDLNKLVIVRFNTGIKLREGTTPAYLEDLDILLCPGIGLDIDATGGKIVGVYINKVQVQLNGVGVRLKGNVNAIVSNGLACRINDGIRTMANINMLFFMLYVVNCSALIELTIGNVQTINPGAFRNASGLSGETISLPTLVAPNGLGGSPADQGVFEGITSLAINNVPVAFQTNNSGTPDGDLQYVTTNGGTVNYV